jgi:hypothetical protein
LVEKPHTRPPEGRPKDRYQGGMCYLANAVAFKVRMRGAEGYLVGVCRVRFKSEGDYGPRLTKSGSPEGLPHV